ncbi:hypothetical protein J6A31_07510 [bacterium]|nr:hypothetical protein [bacterium]
MKRFDYNAMKLGLNDQPSDSENSEKSSAVKKDPVDTHSFVSNGDEVDASVHVKAAPDDYVKSRASQAEKIVEAENTQNSVVSEDKSVIEKPAIQSQIHYSRDNEADIENFVSHLHSHDESDAVSVEVEVIDPVAPASDADVAAYQSAVYGSVSDEERQANEAALRAQTQKSNHRNAVRAPSRQIYGKTKDSDEIPMSHLRKFPTELALLAKQMFPDATNMDDAVAAYIYYKEGRPSDIAVPDRIKIIAEHYVGETTTPADVQDALSKRLAQMDGHNKVMARKLDVIELAVAYALFDHIGFRRKDQTSPSSVDFLEQGMSDLISQLERQSDLQQSRIAQKNGRPIR